MILTFIYLYNSQIFMLRKLFIASFALITLLAPNSAFAQRSYSFNATTLNVDGLPNKILGINVT